MAAPINANKHYVHHPIAAVAAGAISNIPIAAAIVAPAVTNASSVEEGSIVKAIWVEMWIIGVGATDNQSTFLMALEKVPAGATKMTHTQSLNLGAYLNKKNILYSTQGLVGSNVDGGGSTPMIRGWFKIPKGKQRFGLGDDLVLNVAATGNAINICGIFTYKEYR